MAELAEAQKDAELYQWLQDRFVGYDFEWGQPNMVVAVFNVSDNFCGTRDITASIRAAMNKGAAKMGQAQSQELNHAVPSNERGGASYLPPALEDMRRLAEG